MYLSTAIGILSILTYALAGAGIAREILAAQRQSSLPLKLAWAAAGLHSAYTFLNIHEQNGFSFGFFNTASLTALVVVWLLLFAALDKPVAKLGVLVFPVAALLLAANLAYPSKPHPLAHHDWQLTVHILTSILAFGLLNIAAVQAILLAIQEQQLRHHHPKQFMLALPPLQAMEALLFQMIATGLGFLTISLLTGFLFIDDLFAQHLAHKTVLSILAWLIFSALLFGRLRYGWRGQSAVQWTLIGFTSLLLAYFGSKLVLELILKKI
ncbi:phosphohydrolase [Methylomonas sp. LWB]|uniref:cytochrome C assembly family protein n=1 Tax=Methylomonas sp. LWB TaxID=1905845 RepID=UPI0008D908A4|nr:cytochrome c biogenesis protein CcsA [Methylomonas sp. LWB]OHX38358.1 phosphohydrolase [Methylomonas sp. LWB]